MRIERLIALAVLAVLLLHIGGVVMAESNILITNGTDDPTTGGDGGIRTIRKTLAGDAHQTGLQAMAEHGKGWPHMKRLFLQTSPSQNQSVYPGGYTFLPLWYPTLPYSGYTFLSCGGVSLYGSPGSGTPVYCPQAGPALSLTRRLMPVWVHYNPTAGQLGGPSYRFWAAPANIVNDKSVLFFYAPPAAGSYIIRSGNAVLTYGYSGGSVVTITGVQVRVRKLVAAYQYEDLGIGTVQLATPITVESPKRLVIPLGMKTRNRVAPYTDVKPVFARVNEGDVICLEITTFSANTVGYDDYGIEVTPGRPASYVDFGVVK